MSRSVKKTPIIKDNKSTSKERKTHANQIVRRKTKNPEYEIAEGNQYRKHFPTYDIHDYICRWTKEQALEAYQKASEDDWPRCKFKTEEEFMKYWFKTMRRK